MSEYVPGVCNIGAGEIARRRQSAIVAGAATAGLAAAMLALHAPRLLRLAIALPAASTAVSALQAREHFCVAYGTRGVQNVTGTVGVPASVLEAASRAADRRRAMQMIRRGALVGAAAGLAFAALPLLGRGPRRR